MRHEVVLRDHRKVQVRSEKVLEPMSLEKYEGCGFSINPEVFYEIALTVRVRMARFMHGSIFLLVA